ncbi:MAG: hypothetical protein RL141_357 [Candidatus Parcubacteria bacterium]|jgi:UDP-N-acetylmuramoyl-L-alanyl-D-glutamate--2,6-diaminopimelate ligase
MYALLAWLRKVIPAPVFGMYHRALSWLAAVWYGFPSKRLIVIGVTGTSGKTTTCYLLAKALEAEGATVGCTTTAFFKIGSKEWPNATKMTMLGRFQTQNLLRQMVDAGCTYAVVETSSQGIAQGRHRHVAYDVCVFTNLTPEHLEAHGGFEPYKQAKISLFRYAATLPPKMLHGHRVPRIAVLNADSPHAPDFAVQGFNPVVWFGMEGQATHPGMIRATDVQSTQTGSLFHVGDTSFHLQMPGTVMVQNALAAIATAESLGIPPDAIAEALANAPGLPGRYERIDAGQPFIVMVDYAFEPNAITKLYESVSAIPHKRIIHLLGSTGGGRDIARRAVIGKIAGERADIVIVTNEDPYDDNPQTIIDDVAGGAVAAGKKDGENLFSILDRREAIQRAITMAQPGDLVLITGKGSEPVMAVAGGVLLPWSDAEEVRKALKR